MWYRKRLLWITWKHSHMRTRWDDRSRWFINTWTSTQRLSPLLTQVVNKWFYWSIRRLLRSETAKVVQEVVVQKALRETGLDLFQMKLRSICIAYKYNKCSIRWMSGSNVLFYLWVPLSLLARAIYLITFVAMGLSRWENAKCVC